MGTELSLYEIDLQTEISASSMQILSDEECYFADNIRNEMLRKQHIKVRVGLRQILASYLNQTANHITIAKTEYGKPYLPDYPDMQFNISHSGNTLLVAISSVGAVGIDIEQAKSHKRGFSGLVAKCFAKQEQDYWFSLPECEKTAEFYRFWTRKEAFVKAVGRGLALGLQSCVVASGKKSHFISIPKNYGQALDWQLFDLPLESDLYGALVVESEKLPADFKLPDIIPFALA